MRFFMNYLSARNVKYNYEKMIVSIIVAASENNVIGNNNDLIWSFPNDMSFFQAENVKPSCNNGKEKLSQYHINLSHYQQD